MLWNKPWWGRSRMKAPKITIKISPPRGGLCQLSPPRVDPRQLSPPWPELSPHPSRDVAESFGGTVYYDLLLSSLYQRRVVPSTYWFILHQCRKTPCCSLDTQIGGTIPTHCPVSVLSSVTWISCCLCTVLSVIKDSPNSSCTPSTRTSVCTL